VIYFKFYKALAVDGFRPPGGKRLSSKGFAKKRQTGTETRRLPNGTSESSWKALWQKMIGLVKQQDLVNGNRFQKVYLSMETAHT
jgi:hypothetical protein